MSELLELKTAHGDVADVVEELAPHVDESTIRLPSERAIDEGEWVRFDVQLADGSTVLEGVGRCQGTISADGASHRVVLSLLQFDVRNEIMFERIVLASGADERGDATGEVDLAQMKAKDIGTREPKTDPPPPPRPPPPPKAKPSGPPRPPSSKLPPAPSAPPPPPAPLKELPTKVGSPSAAPPPLPLKRASKPPAPAEKPAEPDVHEKETAIARPIDEEKTSVAPAPEPPPGREPEPSARAAPTPPPEPKEKSSAPPPGAAPSGEAAPEEEPERPTTPEPPPSSTPPAPSEATPSENTAPQEIATLDTVVSRPAAPRRPTGDGLRLNVPARFVARARALAPTLPPGVVDAKRGRTETEAVLHAAMRLGLASLAAMADDDDDA